MNREDANIEPKRGAAMNSEGLTPIEINATISCVCACVCVCVCVWVGGWVGGGPGGVVHVYVRELASTVRTSAQSYPIYEPPKGICI